MKKIISFLKNESGAVTVDWVVLTAGVVLLASVVLGSMSGVGGTLSTKITTAIGTPATITE